jgi:O-antigen/teichoic acid export membrane protein
MHRTIGDLDRLLVLWGCVALLGLGRDILQTALQALQRLKIVAALTGVAAVVSIAIMWFGLRRWGAAATLIGQIAGETLILIGTVLLILQSHRRTRVRSGAASTDTHVLSQK